MKITTKGLEFAIHNDVLTWLWWWKRSRFSVKYSSENHGAFLSLAEYLVKMGAVMARQLEPTVYPNKIVGHSYDELMRMWAETYLREGIYVVMHDINVQRKPASFWHLMEKTDRIKFTQDVVILRCKDYPELQSIVESTDKNFARALGFIDGRLLLVNEDE